MSLILVNNKDLVVGQPIPWSLYTEEYALLLSEGDIVHDEKQRNELLTGGAYRELSWETSNAIETAPDPSLPQKTETGFTFDDMHLKVGDRLQLEPPSQRTHERFTVRVIGYLKGSSLLVSAPVGADGLRVLLNEKDKVIMRSFSGVNAFAFVCSVDRIIKIPYEYLHLSFPDAIQGIMIRKSARIKTNIIATVQNTGNSGMEQTSAVISDISAEGVSLVSKQSLGNKEETLHLTFRLRLHNIDVFLATNGAIRTVTQDDEPDAKKNGLIRHGIQFQNLQPNDSVILQSMVYQQMIENPHRIL